jgi:hypothetical protein
LEITMYVSPQLTDLGSFQELTLGAGMHSGVLGPVGSLVNGTLSDVNGIVHGVVGQLPGVSIDDNSHAGTNGVTVDPSITITPR